MKNVYDDIARTDRRGYAVVTLPRYFGVLNRDFRYQLTTVGRGSWGATVGIWKEIAGNRFTIRSDRPHVTVSWQVTGIRRDAYANAHRIRPELAKPARERGTYLHPEIYGRPHAEALVRMPRR
jgi:trimeric autotransporter adhesin